MDIDNTKSVIPNGRKNEKEKYTQRINHLNDNPNILRKTSMRHETVQCG